MEAIEFLGNVVAYSIILDMVLSGIIAILVIAVFIWILLDDIF